MGEIVAAVGTCHTPYLFTRPPDENPEQLDLAAAGMRELGKVLDETKPDVIVFFGSDHVETFSVTCVPSRRSRVERTRCPSIARWPRTC
jgi:2,3-dihydroxyphenylpropionate 1,2-dioxygenase